MELKLAIKGEGGLVIVTVCWEVVVCCGEPPSLTVRVTVYVPAME